MNPLRFSIATAALAALSAAVAGCCCNRAEDSTRADALVRRQDAKPPASAHVHDADAAAKAYRKALLAVEGDAPAEGPTDGAAEDPDAETEAQMWATLEKVFGRKGQIKDGVYRHLTPRPDLFVTMEGMDVPTGAFLESDFRFWRCPCGKLLANGQFVLADYEVNDVVDELHEGRLHVVTIAPLLLHEHPRLLMVRFQAEGRTRAIAEALKSALSYTGEERNAPLPANLAPKDE